MNTYVFTYKAFPGPRTHAVTQRFKNQVEAEAFADGLWRGGAFDIHYDIKER